MQCDAPDSVVAWDCNCSICYMRRNTHFMVAADHFRLITGEDSLSMYQFNTKVAKHYFCKHCGICSFYVPRSNPGCYAVTIYCLEPGTMKHIEIKHFDGIHWEDAYAATGIGAPSNLSSGQGKEQITSN